MRHTDQALAGPTVFGADLGQPGAPGCLPESMAGPGHPGWHEGEWRCWHGPCPVQVVVLRVRFAGPFRLPRLRCPLCLRTLEFSCWLTPWT